jgi:hypothetical protein
VLSSTSVPTKIAGFEPTTPSVVNTTNSEQSAAETKTPHTRPHHCPSRHGRGHDRGHGRPRL